MREEKKQHSFHLISHSVGKSVLCANGFSSGRALLKWKPNSIHFLIASNKKQKPSNMRRMNSHCQPMAMNAMRQNRWDKINKKKNWLNLSYSLNGWDRKPNKLIDFVYTMMALKALQYPNNEFNILFQWSQMETSTIQIRYNLLRRGTKRYVYIFTWNVEKWWKQ